MRTSIAWMILATVNAWCQNSYVPLTADTSLLITNSGVRPANVSISFTNDDGSALTSGGKVSLTLPAGATRILPTPGDFLGSGTATIGSDQFISVWGAQSGPTGEAAFAAAPTSTGFRIPVDSSTSVSLYNPGPAVATVTASLVDSSGAPSDSQSFTLAAGARLTRSLSNDPATLTVTSTVPLAAQVIRTSGAILEAAPLTSKRMHYYFPRLGDGPYINSTFRTTFLLTNLSKKPAKASATLTREDGSPWNAFEIALAPGTSTTWQSDGAGPYTTGAASIQSDAPLGVQAFVAAYDSQGVLISETAVPDARPRQQVTIPFDITANLISGAVLYNLGPQPVTLTLSLLDTEGTLAASTQAGPVPPGGQISGAVTDFFPGTSVLRGALLINSGNAFVSVIGTRQNPSLSAWPSALPAGSITLNGVPISVITTTDDQRAISANISPKGGSLSLTDAAGNKFTLTIPPNALLSTEKIVMTPVTAAKGVPGSGLLAVQLAPDGLVLLQPATLAIQAASTATLTPIGWYGASTPGVYLNLPQPKAAQFTMLLTHFSNAGAANLTPGDLTAVLLNIIDLQAYYHAQAAAALVAQSADGFSAALNAEWEQVIAPLIEAALSSQDDNVIECAIYHALAYNRQVQLLGTDPLNVIGSTITEFMTEGRHILIQHAESRCTKDHDFTALMDLLTLLRQDALLTGNEPVPDYSALQQQCPYKLQFEFQSLILSHYPGVGYFKGQISAKIPLTGTWDKTTLTAVNDPSTDLYASYQLSAIGNATYDSFAFETEGSGGCTIVATGLRPGKVTVTPQQADGKKSQVQFMFSAAYDPAAYSQSGVQLCAFCPVYRKKLQKVDLLMNPGLNWEDITQTCPVVGSVKISQLFWNDGWITVHPADKTSGLNYFPNWELVVTEDLLAQMKSTVSVMAPDHSSVDSTTMKLTRGK